MAIPRFRKKSDKDMVVLPGIGRIAPGQILEGPEYKRFVDLGLLEPVDAEEAAASTAEADEKEVVAVDASIDIEAEIKPKPKPKPSKEQGERAEFAVDLPSTEGFEDPDLESKASEVERPEVKEEATEAAQEAKMKKRAAARRRGSKKK